MGPVTSVTGRSPKTVSDWLALPDDVRAELIDGEILVTPSPSFRHQDILGRVYRAIASWIEAGGGGRVAPAPVDVHLPSGAVVQPDVVFVASANLGVIHDVVRGVPDLLVEVVSPSRPERDVFVKRDLYARNGVPEYWIVRPDESSVEVLRLAGTSYRPAGYFLRGAEIRSPMLSGFALPTDDVFREP
jgi:Uma2 family endonuclease